jgi:DNA modification methylase
MLQILIGDCLEILPTLSPESIQCCVTSPPYFGLRDYGTDKQFGLEKTPEAYVTNLVAVFREVKRVLRDDGTFWLNLGDSYSGNYVGGAFSPGNLNKNGGQSNRNGVGRVANLKPKNLVGIPWRVAFALQADGWYLRSDIIWHKPNPMPESVTDRPTKAHEYIFLLTKSERYFYDAEAIREPYEEDTARKYQSAFVDRYLKAADPKGGGYRGPFGGKNGPQLGSGSNKRTVWTIATQPYSEAHFATFPEELPKLCILAGSKPGDMILDPFAGSGTTGKVAIELGRRAILIELNPAYIQLAEERCNITPGWY